MAQRQAIEVRRLDELFAAEPDRLSRLTFMAAGIYFDWSKTHLDQGIIDQFIARAEAAGFAGSRDALFAGDIVNPSEGRPATHVAERGNGSPRSTHVFSPGAGTRLKALEGHCSTPTFFR